MAKIEFVEYTGCYPCLCMGELFVKIDGITTHFGGSEWYDEEGNINKFDSTGFPVYPDFWRSGGCVTFDENYIEDIEKGPWVISINNDFPEEMKRYLPELIRIFNENVHWGCCGGCV